MYVCVCVCVYACIYIYKRIIGLLSMFFIIIVLN